MRKEVILAIVGGVVLGLLVIGGLWWTNKATTEESLNITPTPVLEQPPTLIPVSSLSLEIISPEDESIIEEEKITLEGKTAPESVVVVIYPEGENIVEADKEGNFETEITLVGGANEIKITAYDEEGNQAEKNLTLVYSTAKI
jgi:hypothetical protein